MAKAGAGDEAYKGRSPRTVRQVGACSSSRPPIAVEAARIEDEAERAWHGDA